MYIRPFENAFMSSKYGHDTNMIQYKNWRMVIENEKNKNKHNSFASLTPCTRSFRTHSDAKPFNLLKLSNPRLFTGWDKVHNKLESYVLLFFYQTRGPHALTITWTLWRKRRSKNKEEEGMVCLAQYYKRSHQNFWRRNYLRKQTSVTNAIEEFTFSPVIIPLSFRVVYNYLISVRIR